jgi:hypothetical protein
LVGDLENLDLHRRTSCFVRRNFCDSCDFRGDLIPLVLPYRI